MSPLRARWRDAYREGAAVKEPAAYDVVIRLKVSLTIRVEAESKFAAEDVAHEVATDAVARMSTSASRLAVEDDRAVTYISAVQR